MWISVNAQLFLPCAVVDGTDPKFLTVAFFDVQRPDNKRKYNRKKIIPYFHLPQLNSELLVIRHQCLLIYFSFLCSITILIWVIGVRSCEE